MAIGSYWPNAGTGDAGPWGWFLPIHVFSALVGKPEFVLSKKDIVQQTELDLQDDDAPDRGQLMSALDELNQRYGRGTVLMASAGLAGERRAWSMKQERRTPGYTTCWADMPVVRA